MLSMLKIASPFMSTQRTSLPLSRRKLLSVLGLGGALGGGLWPLRAVAGVPLTRIDMHAHVIPDAYRQAFQAHAASSFGVRALPSWSVGEALSFMDRFGIEAQVVSLPDPGLTFMPDLAERVKLARALNEYVRDELIKPAPGSPQQGRFGGFATLPLADPTSDKDVAAARAEAIRAMTVLGLDGVVLYSSYKGIYLGDSKLAPLMSTLNLLGAHVLVQATAPISRPNIGIPAQVLEAPFEITRAATNMLYKSVYLLYPGITWQLGEGGGTIPFLSYRSGLLALNLNPLRSSYARLVFDTAQATSPASVAALREVTETSHILLGTDFPYSMASYAGPSGGDPHPELNAAFNAMERQQVDRHNALSLLPRLANRLSDR